MELEHYLEIVAEDSIRIKGHRIELDDIIYYYREGLSPEYIVQELPTLSLEQIYAAITYYLHNQEFVDTYRELRQTTTEALYQAAQTQAQPTVVQRIKALREQKRSIYHV